nr:hypothetical protein [Lacticaseibacillus thailandensis]
MVTPEIKLLSAAEQERFDRLYAYTESVLAADRTGHSLDHINRVLANAVLLLHDTPAADTLTVVAAATLHDTYDDKLVDNVPAARRKTAAMLADQGLTKVARRKSWVLSTKCPIATAWTTTLPSTLTVSWYRMPTGSTPLALSGLRGRFTTVGPMAVSCMGAKCVNT